ncbi:MAG: thioredoxin family protein [Prevotella sp.]|nr:thioredoxin family protein [Prevotella sp.]
MTRKIATALTVILSTVAAFAQIVSPVTVASELKTADNGTGEIVFSVAISDGWHVYSTNLNGAGPIEASLETSRLDGVELVGGLTPRGKEIEEYEELFGAVVRYFEHSAQFVQKVKFTKPDYAIDCTLTYGACNDRTCLPPQDVPFVKSGHVSLPSAEEKPAAESKDGDKAPAEAAEAEPLDGTLTAEADTTAVADAGETSADTAESLWQPVVKQLRTLGGSAADDLSKRSLWSIFLLGFVGGLLALVMPCIWPIIPMTVSFFLKRAKDNRRKGISDAFTYGVSIIVIYLLLGLFITLLFGPSKLNELSTNAFFNIFLFVLLVVFALSFFGWFEIKLPSRWANAVDTKASNTSGLISIFLMAFTLALVSFSCTAPIIGLLLVDAVTSGNIVSPAVGMFGFALALALPFTLFALFPSWLKEAPKSGSWMNIVKVTLGFIELAFALKFFSVADLAYGWHLLDREVFLSLWIAIFLLLGLYLVGLLKFQSDIVGGEQRPMPVLCVMGGLVSIAFAVYMLPGLWGAPCKAVSAFAPPITTQDFNLNNNVVEARYTDYDEGMRAARKLGKPVLLDFTGFGCVNCRKMEAAVWTDPRVAQRLNDDYVLISLFVDDKSRLSEPFVVSENGERLVMNTVGKKWSYLQTHKFGANTQPFYVAVDNEGNPLAPAHSYKEDVGAYLDFLNQGLAAYRNRH